MDNKTADYATTDRGWLMVWELRVERPKGGTRTSNIEHNRVTHRLGHFGSVAGGFSGLSPRSDRVNGIGTSRKAETLKG
jgi:hypothetical protein